MKNLYTLFPALLFNLALWAQPCSTTNAHSCLCKDGSSDCDLLPNITIGPPPLNIIGTGGELEFPQTGAGADNGRLRLSVSTPNIGFGNLEIHGTNLFVCGTDTFSPSPGTCPDGSQPKQIITQRIYHKNGDSMTWWDRGAGYMTYHPTHGHMHVDDWGIYTLRTRDTTDPNPLNWPIIGTGAKLGFCVEDFGTCSTYAGHCQDSAGRTLLNSDFPNFGLGSGHYGCSATVQGITVGYTDIYFQYLDGMWINIPPNTCNGDYYIVVHVDPHNYFLEEREDDNVIAVPFRLTKQVPLPTELDMTASTPLMCQGGAVTLYATPGNRYLWSTGDTTPNITIHHGGNISVDISNICGTAHKSMHIDTIAVSLLSTQTDSVCQGQAATLGASGLDSIRWYKHAGDTDVAYHGNSYTTAPLSGPATFYVEAVNGFNNANYVVGEIDSAISGGQFYSNDQYMIFDAYKNIVIEYVNVYADTAGPRYFELRSSTGSLLQQMSSNLHPGLNTVNLHFSANAGNDYQLGWRAGSNPSLYRNIGGLSYPYVSPGLISIKNSSAGSDRYYAFYDWVVHEPNVVCASSRVPVPVTVYPLPSVNISGLATSYLDNATPVSMTGTPPGGTFSGPGVSGNVFNPASAGVGGSYNITYTYSDAHGCSNTSSKPVSVTAHNVGISNISGIQQLMLFPNPSTGWVNLSMQSQLMKNISISITDMSGKQVWLEDNIKVNGRYDRSINLTGLAKGVYHFIISSGEELEQRSIVIE